MRPLATTHRSLVWLCLCTPDKPTTKWHKRSYAAFTTIISIILVCHVSANAVYCLKTLSQDLEKCLFVLLSFIGESCVTYTLLIGLVQMPRKIEKIFRKLQTIYNSCKYFKMNQTFQNNHGYLPRQMSIWIHSVIWTMPTTQVNGCGRYTINTWLS